MKEYINLEVKVRVKNYTEINNLLGYCKYNNLILKDSLPKTDDEIIDDALFAYTKKIETIVSYYNIDRRALNLDEGTKIKNRFKEIIKMIGMKQKELAELTGIDDATVSTILSNKNQPSMEYFLRIWTVLGCPPIEDIFYREKS